MEPRYRAFSQASRGEDAEVNDEMISQLKAIDSRNEQRFRILSSMIVKGLSPNLTNDDIKNLVDASCAMVDSATPMPKG